MYDITSEIWLGIRVYMHISENRQFYLFCVPIAILFTVKQHTPWKFYSLAQHDYNEKIALDIYMSVLRILNASSISLTIIES